MRAVPDAPGEVGDTCVNDDDCNRDDLICRVFNGPGICTKGCENGTDEEEVAACGEGNTCLVHSDGSALCVPACDAANAGGEGCGTGQVCTWFSLFVDTPDDPGCTNFCAIDADCPDSLFCARDGICTMPEYGGVLEDRDADGAPCSLDTPYSCRGLCIPFGYDGEGICGSLIDLAEVEACPDRPNRMSPFTGAVRDDLAVCIFRECDRDADCPEPLQCDPQSGNCVYL